MAKGATLRFSCGALLAFAVTLAACGEARADDARSTAGACVAAAEKAQVERDAGKYRAARRELLICSREACPTVIHQDCQRWLAEVERSTPTIVLAARDAEGRDVGAVRVLVDGEVLVERLDGQPIAIDPGAHVFRYEIAGRAPTEEQIIISAAERDRIVRVRLGETSSQAPPAPAAEPATEPTSGRRTAGFVVLGVGVVGVAVGAVFGARALSKNSDAKALCGQAVCTNPEAGSLSRDAVTAANVANVSIGVGLLALGVGTYLVLTSSSSVAAPKALAGTRALQVTPLLGREVGGAAVAGTW